MSVAIGIPIAGPPTWSLLQSLLALQSPEGGWTYVSAGEEDRPLPIPIARNVITRRALDTGAEWLLHLDVDADLHPLTLTRLLSRNLPIVGALCFTRRIPVVPTIYRGQDPAGRGFFTQIDETRQWILSHPALQTNTPTVLEDEPGAVVTTDFTGLHCLLTHRSVYEKMPEPWFVADPLTPPPATGCDRQFCLNAQSHGFQPHIDRTVYAGHVAGGRNIGPMDFLAWDKSTDWEQSTARPDAYQTRLTQLRNLVPGLFAPAGKRVLYIGASPARCQMAPEMKAMGQELVLLEAYEPNSAYYRERLGNPFVAVVSTDARDIATWTVRAGHFDYDAVVWWHGPEHIERETLPAILATMEALAPLVVLACPFGRYEQGPAGGNPYEVHASHWYPTDFEQWGYHTATLGTIDTPGSHLLAWKQAQS